MIPERYRELLTAFVDGELSSRQRRHVVKLLRRSGEARALLRQMQADSRELRRLTPSHLEIDLSDSVLTQISQRQLTPARAAASPAPPAGSFVPHLVAAAAVLLALALGSYFLFASSLELGKAASTPPAKERKPKAPKNDTRDERPKEAPGAEEAKQEPPPKSEPEPKAAESTPKPTPAPEVTKPRPPDAPMTRDGAAPKP